MGYDSYSWEVDSTKTAFFLIGSAVAAGAGLGALIVGAAALGYGMSVIIHAGMQALGL